MGKVTVMVTVAGWHQAVSQAVVCSAGCFWGT